MKRIFLILFLLILGGLTFLKLLGAVDPDLFFHLKNGELILRQGIFPVKDDYSFTACGKPLIANAWLSETLFYIIFSRSGYLGLVVFHTLVLMLCYLLVYHLLGKTKLSFTGCLILTAVWFLNCLVFIAPRTQNIGFLFFLICLYLVFRWEEGQQKSIWIVVGLIPLWNNFHSGFAMGLVVLLLIILTKILETRKINFNMLVPLLVTLLLTGIHPNGYESLVHPFWMIFLSPSSKNIIKEWTPISISMTEISIPYFLVIFCVVILGLRNLKSRFQWVLLFLLLFFISLKMQRMIPYFAAVGVIVLAKQILPIETKSLIKYGYFILTVLILFSTYSYFFPDAYNVLPWDSQNWDRAYPRKGVEFIRKKFLGKNVFSIYDWGGYLIHSLYPHNRVAIYGQSDLYYDLFDEYEHIIQSGPKTFEILNKINAEVVIVPTDSRLAHALYKDSRWQMVFHKPKESIFIQKK